MSSAQLNLRIGEKDKAIAAYHDELARYEAQRVDHESALRTAFSNLLSHYAPQVGWTLIPELTLVNGARPDGILRDRSLFPRGYWEAKDTRDDLEAEIGKKIARSYPLVNTIFEDSRRAILYQNGVRIGSVFDLRVPRQVAELLQRFFSHEEIEIQEFERAVSVFRENIPVVADILRDLVERERKTGAFEAVFQRFWDQCKSAISPKISDTVVIEMLAQHLLMERLFRDIFNNPDFVRKNVIAQEIESVIQALTARSFNRNEFEQRLDVYYAAIARAARRFAANSRDDWTERQHFLTMVYERFFQDYSVKQADTLGIVYTPQAIVDFMVASVDEVLKREFGKPDGLGEPGVKILDPAAGTGSYIVNILHRIPTRHLRQKYTEDLFCNEIMLLPYYIACLNIEHEYYARAEDGVYLPFPGACFADTLGMAEDLQMSMFSEPNSERVQAEKDAEIMVVIGNPPYNVGQTNENDNNKNREYKVIDARIRETYVKDSQATLRMQLYDPYVKFFRWATDRLGKRDGIVCFVSNNSLVDQIAFDGMRQHLLRDFTTIYHLDLHGNVRQNPKLSGTTHNVFGIQVGVGITIAFRRCAAIGAQLMALHLGYEDHPLYPLRWEERPQVGPDGRVTFAVKKMKLNAERDAVIVNETLTLAGVPKEAFEYRLGNRSALEWVLDQYKVDEDKRSGITSDPNRPDDQQYIAKLVCRVAGVSVETVALTRALAAEVTLPEPVEAGAAAPME